MISMQYSVTLPADYDRAIIKKRIAELPTDPSRQIHAVGHVSQPKNSLE